MRFIQFYKYKIHPRDMGKNEIKKYLSFLTVHENVLASTQKAAFNSMWRRIKLSWTMPRFTPIG
jgi:hypothetical protein